jgi:hypothetical protein
VIDASLDLAETIITVRSFDPPGVDLVPVVQDESIHYRRAPVEEGSFNNPQTQTGLRTVTNC